MKNEMGIKIAKLFLLTAAVYLGMKIVFPMVLPFLAALVIARLLHPLAKNLERRGINKAAARFLAYGVFLSAIGLLAAGMLYLCYCMGSSCLDNMRYFMENAGRIFSICCEKLESVTGFRTGEIQKRISEGAMDFTKGAVAYSTDASWYLAGLLAKIFITLISAFLLLNDYEKMAEGVRKTQAGRFSIKVLGKIKAASGAYIKAQLFIMGIVTAVCIAGLFLLRMPHAFWIGLAIGLFDALPFLGTGTVFVPWALIEALFGKYKNAAIFLAIYMICNIIREVLEPRLVGERLGIPPLFVLMSIYIGVQIYGASGVVLGPLSALLILTIHGTMTGG